MTPSTARRSRPWTKAVRAHLGRLLQAVKDYPEVDEALAEIAEEDSTVVAVDSTGTSHRDPVTWRIWI
jgi:flagellar biosynthesis GTPase FlhF